MIKNFLIPNKKNKYKPYLLRKIAIVMYSLILVFVNSFGGFLGIAEAQASTITASNIIALTNQERSSLGLNTLSNNSQLAAAALAKANNMFEEQYWDHFGPNGETPWQFIRAAGYNYVYAGENLAKGFRTAEGVHEAWMASPTHKANIVSANYKEIGVAVVDGVLLGKETTLVVQMFGNVTTEVYKATATTPKESTTKTTTESSSKKVVVNKEQGEIRSIRIISPSEGTVVTDRGTNIKGDVTNVQGEYTVQVYDGSELLGDTPAKEPSWEFDKASDWSEGSHSVKANIKGTSVNSSTISFSVDSVAPQVDLPSVQVAKSEDQYSVSFAVNSDPKSVTLVSGSEVIDVSYTYQEGVVSFVVDTEQIKGAVSVVLADQSGNTSELDISEYFDQEEEVEEKYMFPVMSLNLGDKISIGIVLFVFILMCIEIFVYWRKGKLRDAMGDIFTVGVWWLVLTIAIFNGFSGVIN